MPEREQLERDRFAEAVGEFATVILEIDDSAETAAYVNDPERRNEARAAAPCVIRFIDLEIDPPKDYGPGRGGDGPSTATLAKELKKDLPSVGEEAMGHLRLAMVESIAIGYAYMVGVQAAAVNVDGEPALVDSDPAALWSRWIPNIDPDRLKKNAPTKTFVEYATTGSSRRLVETLERLGLYKGMMRKGGLRLIGELYGRIGFSLRTIQTGTELDREIPKHFVTQLENWPFRSGAPAG